MKQIFEWLREQTGKAYYDNKIRLGKGMKLNVPYNRFVDLINEAEAKWEKEVCEWKHKEYHSCCLSECNGVYEDYDSVLGWEFCPYCGKPIKIVEVE